MFMSGELAVGSCNWQASLPRWHVDIMLQQQARDKHCMLCRCTHRVIRAAGASVHTPPRVQWHYELVQHSVQSVCRVLSVHARIDKRC
jgi:hypothetical protein